MKKVGIITTHRQTNWGSVLQCYALQEALKKCDYDVDVIDYYPDDVTVEGRLKTLKNKSRLFKNPLLYRIAKVVFSITYKHNKNVFDPFIKNNLALTDKVYYSAKEIKDDDPKEDIYCCGGDQTLNGFKMLDVFDNLSDKTMKVAYSSSFGKITFSKDEYIREVKSLSRFDFLSCREDSGVEIMREMGLGLVPQIIDSVFLLGKEDWEQLASNKYKWKKYIFVYNLHHYKEIEKLEKALSEKYNIPVINVCNHWFEFYRYGKFMWCPSVEDWLGLIMDAEYVLSDSFHATAFSLLFHKKYLTIVPNEVGTRVDSISNLFHTQERLVIKDSNADYLEIIDREIDGEVVNTIIQNEKKKAIEYINSWKG